MDYYLGIDMGTSSTKILLLAEDGTIAGSISKEYDVSMPKQGWREIDPEVWFQAVVEGIKEILSVMPSGVAEKIKGIGVTGQMHSTVFLDRAGKSVRPVIMWNDNRTQVYIRELKEQILNLPEISHISNIISTGSPAANLYWLKENEPSNYEQLYKFLIGPDFIVHRLTGMYTTDYCEASTSSLYNLYKDIWSVEMQELLGLDKEVFPEIKGSGEFAGNLLPDIAKQLNLNYDVKVIVGTGDNPAAGIVTGCLTTTYPVLSIGTSGVLMSSRDSVDFSKKGKNIRFSIDGEKIITFVQGAVQAAGNSLNWWSRGILQKTDFGSVIKDVDIASLGNGSLLFYPHLVGDKTIFADPTIRGAFIGIGTDTTRADMQIAVMEGISFAFRELAECMQIDLSNLKSLKVTGGGSKSDIWMQILSNVLNVAIEPLTGDTGASYGIALLAKSSCTGDSLSIKTDCKESQTAANYMRPFNVEVYNKKYKKYKRLYKALKEIDE